MVRLFAIERTPTDQGISRDPLQTMQVSLGKSEISGPRGLAPLGPDFYWCSVMLAILTEDRASGTS